MYQFQLRQINIWIALLFHSLFRINIIYLQALAGKLYKFVKEVYKKTFALLKYIYNNNQNYFLNIY